MPFKQWFSSVRVAQLAERWPNGSLGPGSNPGTNKVPMSAAEIFFWTVFSVESSQVWFQAKLRACLTTNIKRRGCVCVLRTDTLFNTSLGNKSVFFYLKNGELSSFGPSKSTSRTLKVALLIDVDPRDGPLSLMLLFYSSNFLRKKMLRDPIRKKKRCCSPWKIFDSFFFRRHYFLHSCAHY